MAGETSKGGRRIDVEFTESWGPERRTLAPRRDWRTEVLQRVGAPYMALHVGEGWRFIVEALFDRLLAEAWDRQLLSVQERHGGLLVRLGRSALPQHLLACRRAQERSFRTCSRCGEPGYLQPRGQLMETTCVDCHVKLMEVDADGRQPSHQL